MCFQKMNAYTLRYKAARDLQLMKEHCVMVLLAANLGTKFTSLDSNLTE